jgi:cell division protein FtsW
MGVRAFINKNLPSMAGVENKTRRPIALGIDIWFLLFVVALLVFGMVMVFSASWDFSYKAFRDSYHIFARQLQWLGIGTVLMIGAAFFNYHYWKKLVVPGMLGVILLLIGVLLLQEERLGAVRSLSNGSYQPSEMAKLFTVIYLSVWLYNRRDQLHDWGFGLVPLGVILGVVGSLIALQPDVSAVLTVFILGIMMFFLAGGDWKQIIFVMGIGLLIGLMILQLNLFPTAKERISDFWAGLSNLLLSSDHVKSSLQAFINGGWFGVGIGKSQTKLVGLPFPHTDSIFAVVGEETGVVGALMLVFLYVGLMWRGLLISQRAPDLLGTLLAGGLSFWIATEATINMAVMVGLMPFAGNALPLISYGGSSLVFTMVALGIILSVSRQAEMAKGKQERTFSAIVDLRGRNRGRRVSGARGSSVTQRR